MSSHYLDDFKRWAQAQEQRAKAAEAKVDELLTYVSTLEQGKATAEADAESARDRANQEIARRERAEVALTLSEQKRLMLVDRAENAEARAKELEAQLGRHTGGDACRGGKLFGTSASCLVCWSEVEGGHPNAEASLSTLRAQVQGLVEKWRKEIGPFKRHGQFDAADSFALCADALASLLHGEEPVCSYGNRQSQHRHGGPVEQFCGCGEFETKGD